jgi:diguanylate cyclase (GGDEF)-like protein
LTGLANRRRFVAATTVAIVGRRDPTTLAVLFLDIDDFKTVNDGLGHGAGDKLLAAVAERIRDGVRETDVAARLGGDEFGVLLVDVPDLSYAADAASRLLESLDATIDIDGIDVSARASIGIAMGTAETKSVDDLLGQADIAMYRAKAQGKGRYYVFSPDDVLDSEAVAGRIVPGRRTAAPGRGPSFRKPSMGQPALGPEPG